jgi:hypothetical protein
MNSIYFVRDGAKFYTTTSKPKKKIYLEGAVKLRGTQTQVNVISLSPLEPGHKFTTSLDKRNISVYKSNLQKCVRRRLTDNAIRTTYSMLSVDTQGTLRRLPIVMLEDVLLHPSIVPLVWYMMATTKGYLLSDKDVSYVLGIVLMLCNIEKYEVKGFSKERFEVDDMIEGLEKDVLLCMQFRIAYGGMECDRDMLRWFQIEWSKRFEKGSELWSWLCSIPIKLVDLGSIGMCDKGDLILEAIDYHCYPWIIKKLAQAHPNLTEYEIKGGIWFYRSRINVRKVCAGKEKQVPELKEVYDEIRTDLEMLCAWIYERVI